jgi:NAD kinase
MRNLPTIVVVTRPTRLEGLKERWVTARAARFRIKQAHTVEQEQRSGRAPRTKGVALAEAEADFADYEEEDSAYHRARETLLRDLDFGFPVKFLDRSYLPNYDFWNCVAVVVLGQDGLVANTAKYVGDLPIVGVNPDPKRFDGVLLPFQVAEARRAVGRVLDKKFRSRAVTLAEVGLNDGQRLLAFNDFFAGSRTHVSARYTIEVGQQREPHSSSGILISTGVGSTGWMSSVFNMTSGVARLLGKDVEDSIQLDWDARKLIWAVREPFKSKHSQVQLVAGLLAEGEELVVESLMTSDGVIFSDGVEADFLQFTSGAIARFGVSKQRARLVTA